MSTSNPNDSKTMTGESSGGTAKIPASTVELKEYVTIRFAGDSGDGMQLTGSQFTGATALSGNDLATLPDFPAEIRAPAGTLAGVSGYQIQFGSREIFTPGDRPDVLIAMNPAALRANIADLHPGAMIVVNRDSFDRRSLDKVGYTSNPVEDGSLSAFRVVEIPISTLTQRSLESSPLSHRDKERCKNFFALGLMYWMYNRPAEYTLRWIDEKFGNKPDVAEANRLALQAGYNFGVTTEIFGVTYRVPEAKIAPGLYRNITGNQASAIGFVAGAKRAGLELFLGSYPITPASDILHELSRLKAYGVKTFQAEDEIAAVGSAIGAAYGGALGLTTTSGPGLSLKAEAIGLAVMVELPLVIANIQRGGPSTGLPTKTEQADLLQAVFGRHAESPLVVVAPATPSDCFNMAVEATRLATRYMTPVIYLSDGYLANGAEPWLVPDVDQLPDFGVSFRTEPEGFLPYKRHPDTLARDWVRPGTPGLEHRIGGLEKGENTGNVSYDSVNHERMVQIRAKKIARIAEDIPDAEIFGETVGDLLLVGWGGTFGSIRAATQQLQGEGHRVSHMHLRHLNPLPKNVESALRAFRSVAVCELNLGQLRRLLRAEFLVDAKGINKVQGQPFRVSDIVEKAKALLSGSGD